MKIKIYFFYPIETISNGHEQPLVGQFLFFILAICWSHDLHHPQNMVHDVVHHSCFCFPHTNNKFNFLFELLFSPRTKVELECHRNKSKNYR
jgi:hypothetical protein